METMSSRFETVLLDELPLPAWIFCLDTLSFLYINNAAAKQYGYPREEFLQMTVKEIRPFEEQELFTSMVGLPQELQQKKVWRHKKKNGELFDVEIHFNEIIFKDKRSRIVIGKPLNSAHSRDTSGFIDQKNEINTSILHRINDFFVVLDEKWNIVFLNESVLKLMKKDVSVFGKNFWETFPELIATNLEKNFREAMLEKKPRTFVYVNKETADPYLLNVYPAEDGITIFACDYSAELQTEQKLKKSIEQKEMLIKETHHRVKNNLQLIMSLINLQISINTNLEISENLKSFKNRVRSCSLVHEHLYKSESLEKVKLAEYCLTLIKYIKESYDFSLLKINFETDIEDVETDAQQAIYIGLILNELITNSMKHAFSGRNDGEIIIRLKKHLKNIEIYFADDGSGLPEDFNIEDSPTIGMQLIHILLQQLNGKINISSTNGAVYSIII